MGKQSDPRPNSARSWVELMPMILEAIRKDKQAVVFEALLTDVRSLMTELKRTGQLDDLSVTLQDDAAGFFKRRDKLTDPESKKALQLICNILRK